MFMKDWTVIVCFYKFAHLQLETRKKGEEDVDTLLKRIAQKDKDALTELYMQTKDSVFGLALFIVKNVQDAEDVLQDTYIKIYMAAENYCARGKPLAWILTITRNLCCQLPLA